MRTAVKAVVLLIGMAAGLMAQENTGNVYGHVDAGEGGHPGRHRDADGRLRAAHDRLRRERLLPLPPRRARAATSWRSRCRDSRASTFENVVVTLGKDTNLDVPLLRRKGQGDGHRHGDDAARSTRARSRRASRSPGKS